MRGRREFPPEQLLRREQLGLDEERLRKLERIYHAGQKQAWDGRAVLAELKAKHGGIAALPQAQKDAIGRIFTIILWGELAAWVVAAELADRIEDVEAKMAATSQAFDEARHFYVMRDYLLELGGEIPPLDGFAKTILADLLATDNLLHKLVGMQLMVENVALSLFRMVGEGVQEPVLRGLMAYFQRDEARHVGLGTQYLPQMLRALGPVEVARLQLFQWKIMTLLSFGTHYLKDDFVALGLDWRDSIRHGMETQGTIFKALAGLSAEEGGTGPVAGAGAGAGKGKAVVTGGAVRPMRPAPPPADGRPASEWERASRARGVWVPRYVRNLNRWAIAQLFPADDTALPGWHRAALWGCRGAAVAAERVLRVLS
ncbi:MAG TPA: ferritin-like domain-containing protein [Myxococcota bacterium]|nr:ferritin-like domain-containing protein [Myxococcota bacterium]